MATLYMAGPPQAKIPLIPVEVLGNGTSVIFKVSNTNDMEKLWNEGFFGKGTLSRSDPSWFQRVLRRLNIDSGSSEVSKEEITRVRREERKKFKELRSQAQQYEVLHRQDKLTEEDQRNWEELKAQLEVSKTHKQVFRIGERNKDREGDKDEEKEKDEEKGEDETKDNVNAFRDEDLELLDEEGNIEKLEFLQLQRVELFFLAFALDVVKVTHDELVLSLAEIFQICCGNSIDSGSLVADPPKPTNKFILDYVVYHHFRSLGWCVRSGIKFGCDFLLYKKGPPFMHAEYSVCVIPNLESEKNLGSEVSGEFSTWKSWEDFMAVSRVVGGVRKILVLVFVDVPGAEQFERIYAHDMDKNSLVELLQLYKVTEVVSKRWSPSRTRD